MSRICIGCVGDDFTGSSDAASFLAEAGLKTLLFSGVPRNEYDLSGNIACVIALKTRTEQTDLAVKETIEAFDWLKRNGAEKLFLKYCSTFDSTPKGNIGPVADAALEKYGIRYTILCPALPVNGRTVVDGHLYINGVPLHKTHMKDHPLTPMWDSDIANLMKPQSKYPCLVVDSKTLAKSKQEISDLIEEFGHGREHFYVIPDYSETGQAQKIADVFGDLPLMTGGSGLMIQLGGKYAENNIARQKFAIRESQGKAIVLAGSCSKATLEQIEDFNQRIGCGIRIDPQDLLSGRQTIGELEQAILDQNEDAILLYSSDTPERVREAQRLGLQTVSELLEGTMARLAKVAVENGYSRVIIAGGETSGAVTKTLGYDAFWVGKSIAPGVPILIPLEHTDIRLVLKSGNFGQKDFFDKAIHMTKESVRR